MRAISRRTVCAVVAVAAAVSAAPVAAQAPDTTAPVVGAAVLDPPAFTGMRSPWYRGPVKVTFPATDDVGVTRFEYSLDNGATWINLPITAGPSVSSQVTISQEGSTTVRYRAFDAAGNVSPGVPPAPANTTLNAASTAGATAVRLQSTNGRAAGDTLTIDTGANQETATIASVVTPNPPAPATNVVLAAPLTKDHASGVARGGAGPDAALSHRGRGDR